MPSLLGSVTRYWPRTPMSMFASAPFPWTTTALSVFPFEEPGIGPNAYKFDDRVRYSIHVSLDGNIAKGIPDITYIYDFLTMFRQNDTIRQTYLGAFGHTLIMSEDMVDYVHSHPLDILAMPDDDGGPPQFLIPPGADLEKIRGGPDVTFEGLMPKPGRYRAWTQFRSNNEITTFSFTFNVNE